MLTCICSWFDFLILCLSETSKKRTSCSIMRLVFHLNQLSAVFVELVDVLHLVWNPLSTELTSIFSDTFSFVCLFFSAKNTFFFFFFFYCTCWAFYHTLSWFSESFTFVCFVFLLQFPPYATNETGRPGAIGRREFGHGQCRSWFLGCRIASH